MAGKNVKSAPSAPARRGRKPATDAQKAAKGNESRREKFLRLGQQRMEKALKAVSLIGNLSGSGYEYNETDVKKMEDALADAVEGVMNRFNPAAAKKKAAFNFSDES